MVKTREMNACFFSRKIANKSVLVSLSDYQVRDLNDDINKLMGQKYHWERRIKELGGADYTVSLTPSDR
jgi:pre-mRNA-splicing factor ISY1